MLLETEGSEEMSEGKLYKKIREELTPRFRCSTADTWEEMQEQEIQRFIKILDKAKQNHPDRLIINHQKPLTLERCVEKLQENWRWFEKWFGSAEK